LDWSNPTLQENIFAPLFTATLYPDSNRILIKFLENFVGFDSVDDESFLDDIVSQKVIVSVGCNRIELVLKCVAGYLAGSVDRSSESAVLVLPLLHVFQSVFAECIANQVGHV